MLRWCLIRTTALAVSCSAWSMSARSAEFAIDEAAFRLEGAHRFRLGDDEAWASLQLEDSSWESIDVPGGWMKQGFDQYPYSGWYRIHFDWPAERSLSQQAVTIGPVRSAFEIYLNGSLVATHGRVVSPGWAGIPRQRVFPLPEETLQVGPNVMAIRVRRAVVDGGIRSAPLAIDDAADLLLGERDWLRPILLAEVAFIAFYLATFFYSSLLYTLGYREANHVTFALTLLHIGLSHFFCSELLTVLGWESRWTRNSIYLLDQLFPLTTLLFIKYALQIKFGPTTRWLFLPYTVVCVIWWLNEWTINWLYLVWMIYAAVVFGLIGIWWCIRAARDRHPDAFPLLVGAFGFVGIYWILLSISLWSAFLATNAPHQQFLVPSDWYAWLWLHLCMMWMLAAGYIRHRRELKLASGRVLTAQEDERSRLSQDLHDGVGQSVLAVKLELEMLATTTDLTQLQDGLTDLVESTDRVAEELHCVATDLRPAVLDRHGLTHAIESLAQTIERTTPTKIDVVSSSEFTQRSSVEPHLYRVAQEAIANAVRHGRAQEIKVEVSRSRRSTSIMVRDDGKGFEIGQQTLGLGLRSIQDRVDLLGGRCEITSVPRGGTRVYVEVPN